MNTSASSLPPLLTFVYSADERVRFQSLAWQRVGATLPWGPFWGTLFLTPFVIGLAVFGAYKFALFPLSHLPAVLLSAYIAFAAGVCLIMLLYDLQRRTLARRKDDRDGVAWEFAFDAEGFTMKSALFDTRIPWRSVSAVDEQPGVVFVWLGTIEQVAIPARVFADDTARQSFIAAVRDCMRKTKAQDAAT